MNLRKLPIGIQSFEILRKDDYLYVDKTEFIYKLATEGRQYFLSRPRRFGKSLLLSTMRAYFEGKKELFQGLKITDLEKDWIKYPVFYFDFNQNRYGASADLATVLDLHLSKWEEIYGKNPNIAKENLPSRFNALLEAAHKKTGLGVVVLVDEYDKSLLESEGEALEESRTLFKGFFGNLKSCDEHLQFVFITGVTKFSKVSIFSDLNQLNDISLDEDYSTICGITQSEMEETFSFEIQKLADKSLLSYEDCLVELKRMYDGYHFHPKAAGVYNPFSLMNTFGANEFKLYWFGTGTPTFLIRYLKQNEVNLENISRKDVQEETLTGANYDSPDPVALLYQTGYLTIKDYNPEQFTYNLEYPNKEVERGFYSSLTKVFAPSLLQETFSVAKFKNDIKCGDVESFMNRFSAFLSGNSYEIQGDLEVYFQNTMSVMFRMIGLDVKTEYQTSDGRIDIVIETDKYIYIIELKRDHSPEIALQQIEEKGYDKPFLASGKKIIKLGINFSSETRTIDGWKMAE